MPRARRTLALYTPGAACCKRHAAIYIALAALCLLQAPGAALSAQSNPSKVHKRHKALEHCHVDVNPQDATRESFTYDIIITSGVRRQYGSTLASTLTSLGLSGLTKRMRHLHIVLSTPEPTKMSLIHNMKLYHNVFVHTVFEFEKPPALKARLVKETYYRALRVSDDECLDNMPTLIIEDDILFSSNMDQKLFTFFKDALEHSKGQPHIMSLYIPDKGWPGEPLTVLKLHKEHRVKALQTDATIKEALFRPVHARLTEYWWCAQALFYPTGDVRRMLADFYSPWRRNTGPEEWQDWPIRAFLHQDNHTKVQFYEPEYWSLVQHVGRSSTLFGANAANYKFTHAPMFDFDEKFIADDAPQLWW